MSGAHDGIVAQLEARSDYDLLIKATQKADPDLRVCYQRLAEEEEEMIRPWKAVSVWSGHR